MEEETIYFYIYRITNIVNNKYYIGKHKTKNLNDGYFGSGKLLHRAIKKYGKENFIKEILVFLNSEEEMDLIESQYVIVDDNTYNLMPGGKGGFTYINENVTDEQKYSRSQKAGLKHKHRMENDPVYRKEMGEKLSAAFDPEKHPGFIAGGKKHRENWKGSKHTDETRKKMSDSMTGLRKGNNNPSYGKIWITNEVFNEYILESNFKDWENKGYRKGKIPGKSSKHYK